MDKLDQVIEWCIGAATVGAVGFVAGAVLAGMLAVAVTAFAVITEILFL
jgi:hypothetical protein